MTRGQRGRALARLELVTAIVAICFAAFVWVALPGGIEPMFWGRPRLDALAMAIVGALGALSGLVWMIRIYRTDPEPDQRAWRYRDRD